MNLINEAYTDNGKKNTVLKRSKTGLEAEYHLIDDKGKISNNAEEIIFALKKVNEQIDVVKEIGRNMIEFGSYPDVATYSPMLDMLRSLETAQEVCHSNGLLIYPFATYPGKFTPVLSDDPKYEIKKKIFAEKTDLLCQATGFHHHYSLPKGVFDQEKKVIKLLRKSKLERSMVSSYNFEIAIDPALTLFLQSSPFFQGKYFAKDSRVIVYRGGKKLRYMDGAYARLQQLGGLPPYKQTVTDLLNSLRKRWRRWEREVRKVEPKVDFHQLYPHKLDIGWHPVKLNKHGTLEQRGMDTNFFSVIVAATVMLKFCLKKIQREFIEVVPADFGIDEAFKLENGILYVPPHSYVRNKLQAWSAYEGYDKKEMHHYAKRFLNFAKSVTPKRYTKIIRPIVEMVESKRSTSDKIVKYAKYKGYLNDNKIKNDDAARLALYYANQFPKDVESTKKELHKISEFSQVMGPVSKRKQKKN